MWGAPERREQILQIPGSGQIEVQGAKHFFEGKEEELLKIVVAFLDKSFRVAPVVK
jgi:alpha/beta superfamily hydrolase